MDTHPTVHGITRAGDLITCLSPLCVGREFNFPAGYLVSPEKYISSFVIFGAHVDAETKYTEVEFRIPGLHIWAFPPILKQTIETGEDGKFAGMTYSIEGKPEERIPLPLIKTTLVLALHGKYSNDQFSEIAVKIAGWIRLVPEDPQVLDWYLSQLEKLTTLLAFLAASPMSADCINATVVNGKGEPASALIATRSKVCTYKQPRQFFLLRHSLGAELSDLIGKWVSLYEPIRKPSQLAHSVMYSERIFVHMEFLTFMQALEGFHRVAMGGVYMSKEEYEGVRTLLSGTIPANLTPPHKEALRSRIKWGYEYSLSRRLKDLVNRLSNEVTSSILGESGGVPRSWIDTRNYYTHWDENSADSVLDEVEMHEVGVRLKCLLRALYLDLMGVPQKAIQQALCGFSDEAQYLGQINKRQRAATAAATDGVEKSGQIGEPEAVSTTASVVSAESVVPGS